VDEISVFINLSWLLFEEGSYCLEAEYSSIFSAEEKFSTPEDSGIGVVKDGRMIILSAESN
jgi:hypothetical protein